ncbi:MAG: ammonia-forming cytochrome c nitrite reductase [Thermodesulfobacteriota bacterium]|jgi:nitrite reductase (cytochrome c-552)|nr:ammonia-forming cytochrome c nitrite reductase [Thermodesulfobacteriota bacterium]
MKKSWIITIVSLVIIVPLLLLLVSIKENKTEQQAINQVPDIEKLDPRSSEWGKYFPRQYDSYIQTRKSDEIKDVLKNDPNLVVLWAGYGFSKDYNAPRGHFYALEDNLNTLRTGAPVDEKSGPMPTACWTCKGPDVPRLMDEIGEYDFFTGAWARLGGEIVNSIGCADCHDNKTMQLNVTRPHLKRAIDAEGSMKFADATHQDMRTFACAQCHVEYYFKPTKWTDEYGQEQTAKVVTLPWDNGFSAEEMEEYYDERNFSDWTHKLSKTPMLKAQHPGYETFITGAHGQNGLACADCHMPYVREGGVKYSNHKVGSPLDDIANTCLNCHQGTEKEFKAKIDRKLERKNELAREATKILAQAHLEAARAWELGATEKDMKAALQDIRHGQWRWDYAVAAHGAFFHAPEEILRVLGGAINKAQNARLKLRVILAKLGDPDYEAPSYVNKEEAQHLVGLPMDKLVEEKKEFINGLKQKWFDMGEEKGIYDPKSREGMKLKTSFN